MIKRRFRLRVILRTVAPSVHARVSPAANRLHRLPDVGRPHCDDLLDCAAATDQVTRKVSIDRLTVALADCAQRAKVASLSFGEVIAEIGDRSFAFICLLIALPFLIPVSLGPISTIGGAAFVALGWQMMRGREVPWLPRRMANITLSERQIELMLGACRRVLGICRKISRERLVAWVDGRAGPAFAGLMIILAGVLIAVPLPGLPLTNTIPALCVIFSCVALLERDGLMLLFALFWLLATFVYFAFIAYVLYYFGSQAFDWLKDYLPSWLL